MLRELALAELQQQVLAVQQLAVPLLVLPVLALRWLLLYAFRLRALLRCDVRSAQLSAHPDARLRRRYLAMPDRQPMFRSSHRGPRGLRALIRHRVRPWDDSLELTVRHR